MFSNYIVLIVFSRSQSLCFQDVSFLRYGCEAFQFFCLSWLLIIMIFCSVLYYTVMQRIISISLSVFMLFLT